MPYPGLLHPESMPLQPAMADPYLHRKHPFNSRSDSVSLYYPGAHRVLFVLSKRLWWVWSLIVNAILPLLPSLWGFSFTLGSGLSFFCVSSNILLLMVVQQQVII